jgi:hypothetical protein
VDYFSNLICLCLKIVYLCKKNSNMKFRIDIQESVNEGKFPKILETISPIFTKISNVSFKESSLSKKKKREIELEKNNDESIFFSI